MTANGKAFEYAFFKALRKCAADRDARTGKKDSRLIGFEKGYGFAWGLEFGAVDDAIIEANGATPSMAFRMIDGQGKNLQRMPGDFVYCGDITWLIECKSTKRKSFPFANIQPHQVTDLLSWETPNSGRLSLVAINYETERRMFLVPIHELAAEMAVKKSLHVDRAAEIGIECKKVGGVWDLGLL